MYRPFTKNHPVDSNIERLNQKLLEIEIFLYNLAYLTRPNTVKNYQYSKAIQEIPKSYLPEILRYAGDPNITSFAGGVPDQNLFPVKEINDAVMKVLKNSGREVLQYAPLEGDLKLRQFISQRYKTKFDLNIEPEEIMITTGAQQGLDLIGKIFLDPQDQVFVEQPGYLGAIQAFSFFSAALTSIDLETDIDNEGPNIAQLKKATEENQAKIYYTVANFSNPTGITTTPEKRQQVAKLFENSNTVIVEDDAYGELGFNGYCEKPIKAYLPEQTILLGSFSKSVIPSYRTGWIAAPEAVMEKLKIAKQAADLHTNAFTQSVMLTYLSDNDYDAHLQKVSSAYQKRHDIMQQAIEKYFPPAVQTTKPRGGMFIWATLPDNITGRRLFQEAIQKNIAVIPGDPFYTTPGEYPSVRLNFSAVQEDKIESGIHEIGKILDRMIHS